MRNIVRASILAATFAVACSPKYPPHGAPQGAASAQSMKNEGVALSCDGGTGYAGQLVVFETGYDLVQPQVRRQAGKVDQSGKTCMLLPVDFKSDDDVAPVWREDAALEIKCKWATFTAKKSVTLESDAALSGGMMVKGGDGVLSRLLDGGQSCTVTRAPKP